MVGILSAAERKVRRSAAYCRTSSGTLTSFVKRTTKLRRLWDERASGKTLEEIARELGVCANTVKGWLKKLTTLVRAAMRE